MHLSLGSWPQGSPKGACRFASYEQALENLACPSYAALLAELALAPPLVPSVQAVAKPQLVVRACVASSALG